MIRPAFIAVVILTACAADNAQPPEVRALFEEARRECRDVGGKEASFARDAVRRLDLNGDGRPDFIVDFKDSECDEAASLYCGSGGCPMTILVAQTDGK